MRNKAPVLGSMRNKREKERERKTRRWLQLHTYCIKILQFSHFEASGIKFCYALALFDDKIAHLCFKSRLASSVVQHGFKCLILSQAAFLSLSHSLPFAHR